MSTAMGAVEVAEAAMDGAEEASGWTGEWSGEVDVDGEGWWVWVLVFALDGRCVGKEAASWLSRRESM